MKIDAPFYHSLLCLSRCLVRKKLQRSRAIPRSSRLEWPIKTDNREIKREINESQVGDGIYSRAKSEGDKPTGYLLIRKPSFIVYCLRYQRAITREIWSRNAGHGNCYRKRFSVERCATTRRSVERSISSPSNITDIFIAGTRDQLVPAPPSTRHQRQTQGRGRGGFHLFHRDFLKTSVKLRNCREISTVSNPLTTAFAIFSLAKSQPLRRACYTARLPAFSSHFLGADRY